MKKGTRLKSVNKNEQNLEKFKSVKNLKKSLNKLDKIGNISKIQDDSSSPVELANSKS